MLSPNSLVVVAVVGVTVALACSSTRMDPLSTDLRGPPGDKGVPGAPGKTIYNNRTLGPMVKGNKRSVGNAVGHLAFMTDVADVLTAKQIVDRRIEQLLKLGETRQFGIDFANEDAAVLNEMGSVTLVYDFGTDPAHCAFVREKTELWNREAALLEGLQDPLVRLHVLCP